MKANTLPPSPGAGRKSGCDPGILLIRAYGSDPHGSDGHGGPALQASLQSSDCVPQIVLQAAMQASRKVLFAEPGYRAPQSVVHLSSHALRVSLQAWIQRGKSRPAAPLTSDVATGRDSPTATTMARSLRTPLEDFGIPLLLAHPHVRKPTSPAMYGEILTCQDAICRVAKRLCTSLFRFDLPALLTRRSRRNKINKPAHQPLEGNT